MMVRLFNLMRIMLLTLYGEKQRNYFPIRDHYRLEFVKKCFYKKKFYLIIKILSLFLTS